MTSKKLLCVAVGGICLSMFVVAPASGATLSTNADWTWIKGSTNTLQNGTYGTQGVPGSTNTPGARYGAVSWTDTNSVLWLFGGYGYPASGSSVYLNDLWKFDPDTTNWIWMKGSTNTAQHGTYGMQGVPGSTNTPGARERAVSWTDGTGALWLFGGHGLPASGTTIGDLNDLWKFDPDTTNWTWITGTNILNQYGTYGTQGVPGSTNTPGAREYAVSWTDGTGALWLFGGSGYDASGSPGDLNDLWKFDPDTTNWTWMKGSTNYGQSGVYGTLGVPDPTTTPGARRDAVSWKDASGALWLLGGIGNYLWKYDPATTNWTWMKGSTNTAQNGIYGTQGVPATTNTPGARHNAVSWMDGTGALWLFGGSGYGASGGEGGYLNDLWKFDDGGGISLGTNALAFSATFQGANPAAQMIGLTNVGVEGFTYTNVITYGAGASGWLTVLPAAGAVALNGATVLTNQVAIAGLGAGTYYATNQVTADASNSPQTVVITLIVNAVTLPSAPTGVSASDGTFRDKVRVSWDASSGATSYEVWRYTSNSSGAASKISSPDPTGTSYDDTSAVAGTTYYYWVKAVNAFGASAFSIGDSGWRASSIADCAMVDHTGAWTIWMSSDGYLPSGPYVMSVPGGKPVAADFDGDGFADPAMVANGDWTVWMSSGGYLPSGPYEMSVPGGKPVAADFDGDGFADPAMVANGAWTIWFSSGGYLPSGPYEMSVPGGVPVAADFDGDGFADPAMVANGAWTIWLSSGGYLPSGPYIFSVPGGVPVAADFDGQ